MARRPTARARRAKAKTRAKGQAKEIECRKALTPRQQTGQTEKPYALASTMAIALAGSPTAISNTSVGIAVAKVAPDALQPETLRAQRCPAHPRADR